MEILFKDDLCFYGIKYDRYLTYDMIYKYPKVDTSNIIHLNDAKILYHYRDINNNIYPVYYEYRGRFISKDIYDFNIFKLSVKYVKDYTLNNLKLL